MQIDSARARAVQGTRDKILDAALEVLGGNADAAMEEVAKAAGVVRRTLYGHFPARSDLLRALAERAVDEIAAVFVEVSAPEQPADEEWGRFVVQLWPLADRYRVLVTLRRGEYGADIHAVLGAVDEHLADLVRRGQEAAVFGRHLPPASLSRLALTSVFDVAEIARTGEALDVGTAVVTSLLLLGVAPERAKTLAADARPSSG